MLHFFQIALVTPDLPSSLRFYSEMFDFRHGGAQCSWDSKIQGLDGARNIIWWLVADQPFFQLELFQYSSPESRPLRADWRPSDHGWVRFGIEVPDFDECLARLARDGIAPIAPAIEKKGRRHAAIRDPHAGIIIEIIEAGDPSREGPVVSYVTSSVSDLESARSFYRDLLELEPLPLDRLHGPEDEALWGLPHAVRDGFVVEVGGGMIEVVSYSQPVGRPKPADYRASDLGIQNVALGSRDPEPISQLLDRIGEAGLIPPFIFRNGENVCGYIIDAEREFEFASVPAAMDGPYGFDPAPLDLFGKRNKRVAKAG